VVAVVSNMAVVELKAIVVVAVEVATLIGSKFFQKRSTSSWNWKKRQNNKYSIRSFIP
jgi:hypothetical protein